MQGVPDGPLRILQVVATPIGGEWFFDQVTGLDRLGHKVFAVLPGHGPLAQRLRDAGIEVAIIPFKGSHFRQQPRVLAAEVQLARHIRKIQPDIIHSHLMKAVLCCRLAALAYRPALRIAQFPGMAHLRVRPFWLLDRITLPCDDITIGCCRAIADQYKRMGAGAVAVSRYGFDVHSFDPFMPGEDFRHEFGLTENTPSVGMLAHIYPSRLRTFRDIGIKGHEVFIDAAPRILSQVPSAQLFIIGDELVGTGEYRQRLEARAKGLRVEANVHFIGHRSDAATVLAGLDVVVSPSLSEGASHSIVEALLMQKGVVATSVGGTPEIVQHDETGLLVPPADPAALATAVIDLLSDAAKRRKLGGHGRQVCLRQFDAATTVAELDLLYRRSLQELRAGRRPRLAWTGLRRESPGGVTRRR